MTGIGVFRVIRGGRWRSESASSALGDVKAWTRSWTPRKSRDERHEG